MRLVLIRVLVAALEFGDKMKQSQGIVHVLMVHQAAASGRVFCSVRDNSLLMCVFLNTVLIKRVDERGEVCFVLFVDSAG